jgi:5'-3' exonuclease
MNFMKKQSDDLMDQNFNFMKDFVETYQTNASQAKRNYYLAKLKFDVNEPKGKRDLAKMLYRYLEGL